MEISLSARGAFVMRRKSQKETAAKLQHSKREIQMPERSKSQAIAATRLAVTTQMQQLQQQLQQQQQQKQSQRTCTKLKNKLKATVIVFKEEQQPQQQQQQKNISKLNYNYKNQTMHLSTFSCWLLATLLLALVASTKHQAAARTLHGRHLIYPHRHHVHHRSAENGNMSNDNDNRIHEHINIECRTNDTLTELELLQEAKNTSHSTLCEMESEYAKYLAKYRNSQTEAMLSQELTLHKISLTQPLKYASQAELPALAAKTKELDDEMPNILEALSILYDLLIKTKKGTVDNDLVALIAEKIDHNKLRAEMFPQCKEKRVSYSYDPLTYLNLVPHPFEALLLQEAMMVMRIVNQTYFTIWQRHSKDNANVTCDI